MGFKWLKKYFDEKCFAYIMLKCDIIILKIYLCIRISAKYKKGNGKAKPSCYLSQVGLIYNLLLIKDLIRYLYMRSSCLTDSVSHVVNKKYLVFFCKVN